MAYSFEIMTRLLTFLLLLGSMLGATLVHAADTPATALLILAKRDGMLNVKANYQMMRMMGAPDCTPGYYNNEGQDPGPAARLNVGYPAGATAFFKYLDDWRSSGAFEGLAFR